MTAMHIGALTMLLVAGGSQPGPSTTYTAPGINGGTDVLGCVAQNLGAQPIDVAAQLLRPDGTLAAADQATVPAGRSVELIASSEGSGYCAFHFEADPQTLRGFIQRRSAAGETRALSAAFSVRRGLVGQVQTTTPPLRSIGADPFGCAVQNLSRDTVSVDTELVDENGTVIGSTTDDIDAGQVDVFLATTADHLGVSSSPAMSRRSPATPKPGCTWSAASPSAM